ncbi:MAG: hypothetical protein ACU0BS_11125 [Hasllibacter sp.]
MTRLPESLQSPEQFLFEMFSSQTARRGGIVRRKKENVARFVGLERFYAEVERRGYATVENAGHLLTFCNAEAVRPVAGFAPRPPTGLRAKALGLAFASRGRPPSEAPGSASADRGRSPPAIPGSADALRRRPPSEARGSPDGLRR